MLHPERLTLSCARAFVCVAACVCALFASGSAFAQTTEDAPAGVEEVGRDDPSLIDSALRAFDRYLESIDASNLEEAREETLDPGYSEGRLRVMEKLIAFIRGRRAIEIENEGMVVRVRGDWALVVYQYDTIVNSQTTRVITTAWMVLWEGRWKQFVVAPRDTQFWNDRRSDFNELQAWFEEHAREVAGESEGAMLLPVPLDPSDNSTLSIDRAGR